MSKLRYVRGKWPDPEVPADMPEWMLYALDEEADSVVRMVELFADGTVQRNSIEIEERDGRPCPSLIDVSLAEGFERAELEEIDLGTFEEAWARGTDTPFWNV